MMSPQNPETQEEFQDSEVKYASQCVWLVLSSMAEWQYWLETLDEPFPHRTEQAWAVARGRQGEVQGRSGPGPYFSTFWCYPALTRKRE